VRRALWMLAGFGTFSLLELVVYWGGPLLYDLIVGAELKRWIDERGMAHAAGGPRPYPDSVFDPAAGDWVPQLPVERQSKAAG
jgi:hypothetical protein